MRLPLDHPKTPLPTSISGYHGFPTSLNAQKLPDRFHASLDIPEPRLNLA
jgi:hypothetical protein